MFYIVRCGETIKCWDAGHPYMLNYRVVAGDTLWVGRINKRMLSYQLLTNPEWDIVPSEHSRENVGR